MKADIEGEADREYTESENDERSGKQKQISNEMFFDNAPSPAGKEAGGFDNLRGGGRG
jgi:hypothetical protein